MKRFLRTTAWMRIAFVILIIGVGTAQAQTVDLHHIHGLAYSADGKQLFIPSHYGLAVYSGGKWSKAPGPEHDYMGFSATQDFFYSSGHPAQGSGLVNPFGLMRSRDGGRTWDKVGLEGEADFHLLATSHGTNAVYVYSGHPNSKMPQPGIYATVNQGFTWRRAEAKGLGGEPIALAVHPTDNQLVAAATKSGAFLSSDGGGSFRALSSGQQALGVSFDLDGKTLWVSSYGGKPSLGRIDWKSGQREEIALPPLTRDAVAYIAQNPARRDEYAIATFERDVYVTRNRGKTWKPIARQGKSL